jgi:uncharacterized protein YkwD
MTTQTSQPTTTSVPTTTSQPNQPTTTSAPTTTSQPQSNSTDNLEQTIFNQINQYRAQQGLPALNLDSRISDQARSHSQDMSNGATTFGHDGFTQRVQAIAQGAPAEAIANLMPETAAAENVAKNQGYSDPATQAVTDWLHSPEHLHNIVGNYRMTGIGVAKDDFGSYYFTQIFVR